MHPLRHLNFVFAAIFYEHDRISYIAANDDASVVDLDFALQIPLGAPISTALTSVAVVERACAKELIAVVLVSFSGVTHESSGQ